MKLSVAGLAVFLALGAVGHAAAQGDPTPAEQAQIDAGSAVYAANCAVCHGPRLHNPGGAFDLVQLHADEKSRFDKSVREGKGQMPSWKGKLTDEQIDQVWAYIREHAVQ